MAAEHEEFVQTSDQEEVNSDENVGLFGMFSHLQMGTNLLTNTQDTNPEDQLYEVVNEHNEVLHVFSPMLPSHHQVNPSQPPGIPYEMFSSSESESTDTPHYIIDSSEEEEEDLFPK